MFWYYIMTFQQKSLYSNPNHVIMGKNFHGRPQAPRSQSIKGLKKKILK
ncbi:hypothetical protein KKG31_02530 [Patescibacteria group bacterium]|nr:hypothetical protein [Patescibacteria group bacterium]